MPHRIVLAHSGRQHSSQTALALQEAGALDRYLTSFWFSPEAPNWRWMRGLPGPWGRRLARALGKRSCPSVDWHRVETWPWAEAAARAMHGVGLVGAEEARFRIDRAFDEWAARRVRSLGPDGFIGYEMSSLSSFRACRERGIPRVLDVAAEHWRFQRAKFDEEARRGTPIWGGSEGLLRRVETTKEGELEMADVVLAPSTYARQTLVDGGVAEEKIRVVPYGADLARFAPADAKDRAGRFTAIYVGAVGPRKGLHYLVRAWKALRLKDAELVVVGHGDLSYLGPDAALVTHRRWLPHDELAPLYRRASVFVLPSLMDSFGMVVIEAMASGTPVIVSENTGAKDAVREGVDGFVVPVRDVDALTERIRYLRDRPAEVERMGRNARTQAERYSWEHYRARIRAVAREVLGIGSRGAGASA